MNNPEGDFEIFTMNPDRTELVQLTQNAAFDFDPEWSPDGQKIAFESDRDLFSDIFVMNADGSGQINVTNNRAFDRSPTFAPDGDEIAFDSNLSEGVDNPTGDTEIFNVTSMAQASCNSRTTLRGISIPIIPQTVGRSPSSATGTSRPGCTR